MCLKVQTFTATHRRRQILDGAIEVLALRGYAGTSFAQIAKHLELSSTGMISYHFADKAELDAEVIACVMELAVAEVAPRVSAADSPRARLRAYIQANLDFLAAHPSHTAALVEVVMGTRFKAEGAAQFHDAAAPVAAILRAGQQAGEFHPSFDADAIAVAIRGGIDGAVHRFMRDRSTDLERLGSELAEFYDRSVTL